MPAALSTTIRTRRPSLRTPSTFPLGARLERVRAVDGLVVLADEGGQVAHRADRLVDDPHVGEDHRLAVVPEHVRRGRVVPRLDADGRARTFRLHPAREP